MPTVAQIPGGVRIEQYHGDHPPAHFHAIHGDDSAVIGIARGFKVLGGRLKPGAMRDVIDWATPRRALLALNWVDAAAQEPIQRIP